MHFFCFPEISRKLREASHLCKIILIKNKIVWNISHLGNFPSPIVTKIVIVGAPICIFVYSVYFFKWAYHEDHKSEYLHSYLNISIYFLYFFDIFFQDRKSKKNKRKSRTTGQKKKKEMRKVCGKQKVPGRQGQVEKYEVLHFTLRGHESGLTLNVTWRSFKRNYVAET